MLLLVNNLRADVLFTPNITIMLLLTSNCRSYVAPVLKVLSVTPPVTEQVVTYLGEALSHVGSTFPLELASHGITRQYPIPCTVWR
jgi:hypothetical protein